MLHIHCSLQQPFLNECCLLLVRYYLKKRLNNKYITLRQTRQRGKSQQVFETFAEFTFRFCSHLFGAPSFGALGSCQSRLPLDPPLHVGRYFSCVPVCVRQIKRPRSDARWCTSPKLFASTLMLKQAPTSCKLHPPHYWLMTTRVVFEAEASWGGVRQVVRLNGRSHVHAQNRAGRPVISGTSSEYL